MNAHTPGVAIVSPYPDLGPSHHAGSTGVASYSANLARALRSAGTEVVVTVPDSPGPRRTEHDGDRICVERGFDAGAKGLRAAIDAAASSGAPVVHLQLELFLYGGPPTILAALAALRALRRRGVSTVVTMHQTVDPAAVDRSYTRLHRVPVPAVAARLGIDVLQRTVRASTDATVVHEAPFRSIVGGADVIPHGIEDVEPVAPEVARRRLGIHPDEFVALCFGFVAPYKGLETALEAGEAAGDPVKVVVAGGEHPRLGAAGDPYAADLRRRHGAHARFTGWVPGTDVAAWFRAADVALFPYPEPFSSSGALALALAAGTPSLVSTPLGRCIGAPSDMLVTDAAALGERLRRLAKEPAELAELGHWTNCLAEGRRWDQVAVSHRSVYERVAA